jgi:lipoprotein-anchoring transpeptidase ErfK/SrfK
MGSPSLLVMLVLLVGCDRSNTTERATIAPVPRPAIAEQAPEVQPAPAATTSALSIETPRDARCPPTWRCDYAAFLDAKSRPKVSSILVQKARHQLHLVADRSIVRTYGVALGSGGLGQKRYEGDKTTPIGTYTITGRYPSKWHTYLAIDYPNADDVARHAAAKEKGEIPEGRGPGSAIAIHGHRQDQPSRLHKSFDWTLGCVSLDNDEIDEVANAVTKGTKVVIEP